MERDARGMKVELVDEIQYFLGVLETEPLEEIVTPDVVEWLESIIGECNNYHSRNESLVADSVYDRLVEVLREVKPESGYLRELWEEGSDSSYEGVGADIIRRFPMMSIQTIKSWDSTELKKWIESLVGKGDVFLSYKLDGHGVRVVYRDGELVKAWSRARASEGRDLTRQMRNMLGGYCDGLSGWGVVEVRGEVVLRLDRLEEARGYNPEIKSAFSAVSSLMRPSSSKEENELLDFVAYRLITDEESPEEGGTWVTKHEEYSGLAEAGFLVPGNTLLEMENGEYTVEELQGCVEALEEGYEEYGYFCDGVVAEVDSREEFRRMGYEGKYSAGNVALKVNIWGQDLYEGVVEGVIFTRGKSKLSPVAIVNEGKEGEGVLTMHGNRVRRVPLYEPKNILRLEAYPGRLLKFRYGGEAGVVPCKSTGELLGEGEMLVGMAESYEG